MSSHNFSGKKSGAFARRHGILALGLLSLFSIQSVSEGVRRERPSALDLASKEELGSRVWLRHEKLNVNRATQAELIRIRGIGNAMAIRILKHKKRHGPFKTWRDLLKVRGIGERTLAKLEPYLEANTLSERALSTSAGSVPKPEKSSAAVLAGAPF